MTLLAERARQSQPLPARPVRRAGRLSWHCAVLAVILVVHHLLIGPGQLTQADEGAALAQAHVLADGHGWSIAHPLPEADPSGTAFPIERSDRIGDSFEYVPYAKHPVYPVLLAAALRVTGDSGPIALSIIGTVLAALAAALIARRISPSLDVATFWCTAVASPLLFYSDLVIAHTLGAAGSAFAVLGLTAPGRARHVMVLASGLSLMLACLLRNEAVLIGAALVVALVIDAWRARASWLPPAVALTSTVGAYVLDSWLRSRVLAPAGLSVATIDDRVGFVEGRIEAFRGTVLSPADELPIGTLLGALVVVALVAAAWAVQRRRDDSLARGLLGLGVLAAVLRLWRNPTGYVPGLLPAAPVLFAGIVLFRRRWLPDNGRRTADLLVVTSVLFVLAVSATQYSYGFGPWGGRYFAIGIPLVTPLASAGLLRARDLVDRSTARVALGAIVVVTVALAGVGVTASRTTHRLKSELDQAVSERPDTIVVSLLPGTGRYLYDEVLAGRWLESTVDEFEGRVADLRRAGVEEFLLLTPEPTRGVEVLAPWFVPDGPPVTFETTTLGVRSVLVTRLQRFVASD
jgi:hypothetical protein